MIANPTFVPLKLLKRFELRQDEPRISPEARKLLLVLDSADAPELTEEIVLTSDTPSQILEWTETIRRLFALYKENKGIIDAKIGK